MSIGHHHHHHHAVPQEALNDSLAWRAAAGAVAMALFLTGLKLYGWLATDSLSLFSSLVDSLLDVLISGINLIAVRYALKPADEDHRFGHTAIEDIAGLGQAAFISGSALFIVFEALGRLVTPQPVSHPETGIGIMSVSMGCTLALVIYQRYTIRRTRSLIIEADSLHYVGDLLMNGAVIASLLLYSAFGWTWADPLLACIIAAYILTSAWQIGVRAFHNLMDREMPDAEKQIILDILASHKGIRGHHALRTRCSGRKCFIQVHVELDGDLSLAEAHAISDAVEEEIMRRFAHAEVIIHHDPV